MIRRIEREPISVKRLRIERKNGNLVPVESPIRDAEPELALRYSNGFVTVEISHDALDAFVDMTGDVPLPVAVDERSGDRRAYDARRKVRVVYDRLAHLREVTTRSRDGLYVRINVVGTPDIPAEPVTAAAEIVPLAEEPAPGPLPEAAAPAPTGTAAFDPRDFDDAAWIAL